MDKAHNASTDQPSDASDSLPVEVVQSAADLGKKLEAVLSVTDAKELKALLQQLGQQIVDSAEGKSGAKMPAMRSLQRLLNKKVKHNGKIMTIGDMLVEDAEALVTLSFPKHKNFIGEQVSAAYFGLMQEMAERGVAARKKQAFSREFRHDPRQFPKTKPIIGPEPKLTRSGVVAWWNTITWITQGISAPTLAAWVNSYMSGSKTIPLGGQLLVLAATMVAATVAMGRGMDWFGNYMRREGTVIKGVMAAFKERPALALALTLLAAADAYTTNRGLVYIKAIHPDKVAAVKAFEEKTRKDIMPGIIADTNTRINAAVHTAVEETKRHEDAGQTKSGHSGKGDAYKEAERRGNALPASMERVNNEFGKRLQGLLDEYSSTAQRIAEHSYGLDEGQTERIIALVFDNLYRGRVAQITDEWIVAITEAYDREFASPVGAEQIRVGKSLGTLEESNVATPKLSGIEPDMKRLTSDIKLTPVSMDDAQRKLVERYGEDGAMRVKAMLFILAMLMEIGVVFLAHTNWEKLAFQMRKWIKYGVLASKGATSSKGEMEAVKQREYVPSIKVKRPTHARWHQGAIRQAELDTENLPKYQEILENDSQNLCAMLGQLYGPLSEIFHECWPEFPIITAELVEEKLGTLLQRRFNRPARKARALLLGNPARDNAMHKFRKADRDYKHTIGFTLPQRLEAALGMTPSGWSELMDELIPPRWRGIFQKAMAGSLPLQSSVRREWIDRLVKKSKIAKRPRLSTTTKVLARMTPEDRLVAVENIMQTIERERGFPQEDLGILRSLMFREFNIGDEEDLYEAPIPETDPEEVEEDEFVEDEELVQPVHPERMNTHDHAENFRAGYEDLKDRIKERASNVGRGLRDGLKQAAGVTVDAARTVATPIGRTKAHGGVDDQREKVNLSREVVEAIRAIAGWEPEDVGADNAAEIDKTLRQLRAAYNQADRQMKRDILDQWIKERELGLPEELPNNEWYQQAMEALRGHDQSLRQALEELESDETQAQSTGKRATDMGTRVDSQDSEGQPQSTEQDVKLSEADQLLLHEFETQIALVLKESRDKTDRAVAEQLRGLVDLWKKDGTDFRKKALLRASRSLNWQAILDGQAPTGGGGEQPGDQEKSHRATVRTDLGEADLEEKREILLADANDLIAFINKWFRTDKDKAEFIGWITTNIINNIGKDDKLADQSLKGMIASLKRGNKEISLDFRAYQRDPQNYRPQLVDQTKNDNTEEKEKVETVDAKTLIHQLNSLAANFDQEDDKQRRMNRLLTAASASVGRASRNGRIATDAPTYIEATQLAQEAQQILQEVGSKKT